MIKYIIPFIGFSLLTLNIFAQTDDVNLDDLVDDKNNKVYAYNAFKSPRVINSHSMEMLGKGVMDFRILHRFGNVSGGLYDLFGLDNASMRMGFDFGLSKDLTVGIGRSTLGKELDGFIKYRILHQHTGKGATPISVIYVGGITAKTAKPSLPDSLNKFGDRLGYYHQLIIGRKFNNDFSLQLAPIFVHSNLTNNANINNDIIALGIGTRYKLTQRLALVVDVFPTIYGKSESKLPLSAGVDIETGGHVFQLHFSNTSGMNERAFVTEPTGDLGSLQFKFGFNLSRVFTIVPNNAVN
jgi:hypothetical protein